MPHPNSKVSELKFIIFVFLYVFIHYIAFLSFSFVVSILISPDAFLEVLWVESTMSLAPWDGIFISVLVLATYLWWAFVILLLKSFIWNIYQTLLLAITL